MTGYVELHCHSYFSLLDGASSPQELAAEAASLGMPALALTDHDAVYGAVQFVQAARQQGIRPILGAELTLEDGSHLTLLAEDQTGWFNLCWLISQARHNARKGKAALPIDMLAGHTQGLVALSGCREGAVGRALRYRDHQAAVAAAARLRAWFGRERAWIELQHHLLPDDNALLDALAGVARRVGLGCVATNNVHYAARDGHRLQDVLVCIRHLTTLDKAAHLRRSNSEYYLKSARLLAPLFADYPEALANSARLAERCHFDLQYGLQDLPIFPTPAGDVAAYLRGLCEAALPVHYGTPSGEVRQRLAHELAVIERAQLSNYFLIVWDVVRFARDRGIRCQGRGSAANSLVAYLLGITLIDPLAHDLVFERFLSAERQIAPDIDIDFQADRREEVIQYVYERYGDEHTAMACTFVTFRARSAIRDVGKALGLPLHLLDRAAKVVDTYSPSAIAASPSLRDTFADQLETPSWQQLFELCRQIDGLPRHLSIHNGAMILTAPPLAARVPTEPAAMAGRVVVQWDKEAIEDSGLVKIDLLGLRMLSAVAEAVELVEGAGGQRPDLDALRFDDPAVYDMIAQGDTIGVFQVESRAQAQLQPIFRAHCFADLIVTISLIRPGPIQGDMVHPYIRRRTGKEAVRYPHPRLEGALRETLGVILFQEQVLKVARDLAGFSPGEGELLRRALGKKNAAEALEALHATFVAGAQAQGVPLTTAEEVFDALRAFGGYSFPKSHAAAFAVLVYQSAWLKRTYPAAFFAALLNNQPMGFWSPAVLVGDARRHGVEIRPVDIARSAERCTLEGHLAVRMGFLSVKGFGEAASARLAAARETGPFRGLLDLYCRAKLPQRLIENLILAGALDSWDVPRRKLLWELGKLAHTGDELPMIFPDDGVELPALGPHERRALEYSVLGLSTGVHVVALYRDWLREHGLVSSADLHEMRNGDRVQVAGIVAVHQAPPSAKGFHFITLEDEFGLLDVIVRPDLYQQYARVLRSSSFLAVAGVLQRSGTVVNVLARQAANVHIRSEGSTDL